MITKDYIQIKRIKSLKLILPIIASFIVFVLIFQAINIDTKPNDPKIILILSDQIND